MINSVVPQPPRTPAQIRNGVGRGLIAVQKPGMAPGPFCNRYRRRLTTGLWRRRTGWGRAAGRDGEREPLL